FAVFPLRAGKKNPMTKHGFKDWTDDPDSVRNVWGKYPNANIGITCGEPSGNIVVIDVDKDDEAGYDGAESLDEWELEHGRLPETACAVTGRGGIHYYYRTDGRELHPDTNDKLHIDVRTDGSYVMAAPSVHPNGNAMYWDLHYEDYPIADANDTVYALIDAIYDHGNRNGESPKVNASEFKKGGRNNQLYKMACSLMAQSWDDDAIIASIETYNKMSKNPLPDSEVKKLLKSALSKPKGKSEQWYKEHIENPNGNGGEGETRGRPRKFNHAKVAKQLIADNGACFVDGMPAIRNGKLYEIGWKAVSREIIKIQEDATRTNQKEVQHYLQVMAEQKRQSPPELIAFKNGVLDIHTMELRDYSDDDVIPNIIPHDWDADAECQTVDNVLLKMACGESDILESLMEVMGVCMYRSSEFTQSAILLGEGSNGKSTYIRMLQALLGKENISSLDMSMLGKQFHTGQLAGKLANLGDDISNEFQRGDLLSVFKKVVDGNRVYADVKGVEGFEFEPYATLVFSANEFPRLADYTDGMLRRIFPIEFNAKFSKTDADYDPRISRKITTKKACQRMAVLGVMGLHQVIENNGFTPNAASSKRVEEIKADNNTVLSWALESQWTTETLDGAVSITLYQQYKQWCDESGFQAVSRTKFSRQINKEFSMKTVDEWVNGATKKVFRKA
ncbi:MAG: bifunctional DNA primase/polymerase, partial [Eggerthellaceae bacterium]|nr:bifunctional DNA primase/polymerase [Eggerthellaceae bacterium]